jgi:hypothetical protein
MYSEWSSLSESIKYNIDFSQENTVLKKFNFPSAKDITGNFNPLFLLSKQTSIILNRFFNENLFPIPPANVVKQISMNLGISQAPEPSMLQTEKDVNWSMDVICFGLLLNLQEHEIIKDCVNIYCEWLTGAWDFISIFISDFNIYLINSFTSIAKSQRSIANHTRPEFVCTEDDHALAQPLCSEE